MFSEFTLAALLLVALQVLKIDFKNFLNYLVYKHFDQNSIRSQPATFQVMLFQSSRPPKEEPAKGAKRLKRTGSTLNLRPTKNRNRVRGMTKMSAPTNRTFPATMPLSRVNVKSLSTAMKSKNPRSSTVERERFSIKNIWPVEILWMLPVAIRVNTMKSTMASVRRFRWNDFHPTIPNCKLVCLFFLISRQRNRHRNTGSS